MTMFRFSRSSVRILAKAAFTAALVVTIARPASADLETVARQAIIVDALTGAVLYEKNPDQLMAPSSMSKLMTTYMLYEKIRDKRVTLDDSLPVSERAWRMGGSKMFVQIGSRVRLEDLIRGMVVQSGNDACVVVAEGLWGTEENFAEEATKRAHEIGMLNTTIRNATGWPDPQHITTVRDLATLARREINDFPQFYHYYSEINFTYNGITQGNRNPLLYKNSGADGMKTGHTEIGGYGLVGSAKRGERRLILVFNGTESMKSRSQEAEKLIEYGFREFNNYQLFKAGDVVENAAVWLGQVPSVRLVAESDVMVTLPRRARPDMKVTLTYDGPIAAPIAQGTRVAKLVVSAPGMKDAEIPVLAAESVERLGFFGRIGAALHHKLFGTAS